MVWHERSRDEVFTELETSSGGLTADEAARRLARDGANRLTRRTGPPAWRTLAAQFVAPLVLVLVFAAIASAALGEIVDAVVIAAVVVVNGVIGFVQEHRAQGAIAALDRLIVTEATVVRGGAPRRVPSAELVRGDVVLLQSGDAVPADLRLFEVRDLQVDEAALTGESVPVVKRIATSPAATPLAERTNLAFAGTAVTYGQARGVVVATGDATQTGRIADMVASAGELDTPLVRRVNQLSRGIVWVVLGLAAALFAIEAVRGAALAKTFNAAVALAVGAIPEGLPAAVTILLAVGVSTMARRGALIRRLPAVETLGSTTVICSDKTGTLTENQMTVTALIAAGRPHHVSGAGYGAAGEVTRDTGEPPTSEARELLRAVALCNDTRLVRRPDGEVGVEGDPTEAALLVAAAKAGLDEEALARWPRLDVVPFESQHMYMATLHGGPDGRVVYVKGASDAVLARATHQLDSSGGRAALAVEQVQAEVTRLAADGLRVLCVARREVDARQQTLGHDDVSELTIVGVIGMIDPPRPEAGRAIAACRTAGGQVKMITGDHAVTAAAIAEQLGLEGARDAGGRLETVTGQRLAQAAADEHDRLAREAAVFARVAPEQKLRLVESLQKAGQVVAMTGDGVNDAPALRQADIGIAMGRSGTDVARAAAAMVLTDDNFATIEAAVEEGRGVYDNLVKFVAWTLPTNGGEALVLLTAIVLGAELPMLPVQLLWINLVTAIVLGLSLVFEPKEPGIMERPPLSTTAPLLGRSIVSRVVLVSSCMAAAAFGFFELALARGLSLDQARTIAINTVVVFEVAYLFSCRSLRLPLTQLPMFANRWVWAGAMLMLLAQLAFSYLPPLQRIFHTAAVPVTWWAYSTAAAAGLLVIVETKKVWTAVASVRGRSTRRR